jgi:hypothetical protein
MLPMSEDMGIAVLDLRAASDIRALAAHGPDEATLLPRRMAALGLDPDEVARLEPRVFRSLYWRCTLCQDPGQCARDLADDYPVAPLPHWRQDWQDYCPNAATLNWLEEMPWFRQSKRCHGSWDDVSEGNMRALDAARRIVAKFSRLVAALRRSSDFTCGDCERRERCGLAPSTACIVRAAQIARNGGTPTRRAN